MRLTTRFAAGFAAIVTIFAGASAVAVLSVRDVAAADTEVERLDALKHAAHHAAVTLREMYIHQAHCVIESSLDHLDHYPDAAVAAESAAADLLRLLDRRPELGEARDIVAAVSAVDRIFRTEIVPAIRGGNTRPLAEAHRRLEGAVTGAAHRAEALGVSLDRAADRAHGLAQAAAVRASWLVVGALGLATILAGLVGLSLTRSVVRGIRPLMAATAELASGKLTARVQVDRADELGLLGDAFNAMARDLSAREEEVVVARRTLAVAQLAAGVAHELNNPLGVIGGHATLLAKDPELSAEARSALDVITSETAQCARIVRDLLDLTREPRLVRDRVDLCELVRAAVDRHRPDVPRGVTVEVATPGITVTRVVDPGRMDQVLRNLLRNAVEACGAAGAVTVTVTPDARVRVADTGPGIPEGDRSHVFDPFFTTKPGGTGLGLAVSAALVRAHGGRLTALPAASGALIEVALP